MTQNLSLYSKAELESGAEKALKMVQQWLDPEFREIPKSRFLVFSFKYVGRYGPPEWHLILRNPSGHYWNGCVREKDVWCHRVSIDSEDSRRYIGELVESEGIYDKKELTSSDISEFKKKLEMIDEVIEKQREGMAEE